MCPTADAHSDVTAAADRADEAGDGGPRPGAARLRLAVRCAATRWGEGLALAGEGPALRRWGAAPGGPLALRCDGGGGPWPLWTLEEPLEVMAGQVLEYKYLILRGAERTPKWETRKVGENRHLVVDEAMLEVGVHDDGEFGCITPTVTTGEDGKSIARHSGEENLHVTSEGPERGVTEMTGVNSALDETSDTAMPAHRKLRRLGKGKQGRCYLVELQDHTMAVLKEFKGGGRHAFRAEAAALARLRGTAAAGAGALPRLLGAAPAAREVLMSVFCGTCAPDSPLLPALRGPRASLDLVLQGWLDVAQAVHEAHGLGLVHCDVNPWNVLLAEGGPGPRACLVDWACARGPSEAARGLPFRRRGDFQPEELPAGRVGARTDVYGCAATLLWFLVGRTRKGLPDRSPESLAKYFLAEAEAAGHEACEMATLDALAQTCCSGLEEVWEDRCPDLSLLCESVASLLTNGTHSSAED